MRSRSWLITRQAGEGRSAPHNATTTRSVSGGADRHQPPTQRGIAQTNRPWRWRTTASLGRLLAGCPLDTGERRPLMSSSTEPELRPEASAPPTPAAASESLAVHWRGSGYPVVFLHGQPGGAEIWGPVQQLLDGSGVRTLALDRPGYGATSVEAGGFSHNADVLVEVLTRLGRPAVVVAHSWAAGPALLA